VQDFQWRLAAPCRNVSESTDLLSLMPARSPVSRPAAEGSDCENNYFIATLDIHHRERKALGKDAPSLEQVWRTHFREFRRKGNGSLNCLEQALAQATVNFGVVQDLFRQFTSRSVVKAD
jgi:hypothetical protein